MSRSDEDEDNCRLFEAELLALEPLLALLGAVEMRVGRRVVLPCCFTAGYCGNTLLLSVARAGE